MLREGLQRHGAFIHDPLSDAADPGAHLIGRDDAQLAALDLIDEY